MNNADKFDAANAVITDAMDAQTAALAAQVKKDQKLDTLTDKIDELTSETQSMRSTARAVKNKMWWESVQVKVFMVFITLLVLYVAIAMGGCHFDFSACT